MFLRDILLLLPTEVAPGPSAACGGVLDRRVFNAKNGQGLGGTRRMSARLEFVEVLVRVA